MTDHDLTHRGRSVEQSALYNATPEQIYRAWSDTELISGWFVDRAEGGSKVGDVQTWYFERFGFALPYEVVVAEPNRRFMLRCEIPGKGVGLMEVLLEQEGGKTRMRFINSGFKEGAEWDEEYEGVDSGWQMAFANLGAFVERHWEQPRVDFLPMRMGSFEYADVVPLFRSAKGLASWLTESGEIGDVGSEVALACKDGFTLTGRVLTHTMWESTISVDELNGVLGFKAFACGPGQRAVALHGSCWDRDAGFAKTWEDKFAPSLDRLIAQLGAG